MVDPYWAWVCGPLEPYVDSLRGELERLGVHAAVGGWARAVGRAHEPSDDQWWPGNIGVDADNGGRVLRRAPRDRVYYNSLTARWLRPLLDYLRELGVVAALGRVPATSPRERLLDRYRHYLRAERGLAASIVELNVRMVRPFWTEQLRADGELDLHRLSAGRVGAFVIAQSRKRPRSVGRIVTAMRSLLGFLHVDGVIDRPLAQLCRR